MSGEDRMKEWVMKFPTIGHNMDNSADLEVTKQILEDLSNDRKNGFIKIARQFFEDESEKYTLNICYKDEKMKRYFKMECADGGFQKSYFYDGKCTKSSNLDSFIYGKCYNSSMYLWKQGRCAPDSINDIAGDSTVNDSKSVKATDKKKQAEQDK